MCSITCRTRGGGGEDDDAFLTAGDRRGRRGGRGLGRSDGRIEGFDNGFDRRRVRQVIEHAAAEDLAVEGNVVRIADADDAGAGIALLGEGVDLLKHIAAAGADIEHDMRRVDGILGHVVRCFERGGNDDDGILGNGGGDQQLGPVLTGGIGKDNE